MVVPKSYTETEAQRFGDKISVGDIRYADFNPFETAESCSRFDAGFGLLRYSDIEDTPLAHKYTLECTDADAANGYIILSGQRTTETLPGNATQVFFMSEYVTANGVSHFIAVSSSGIYERAVGGVWAATTFVPAFAPTCAAIFGSVLLVGFGTAGAAQWTSDLITGTTLKDNSGGANPLYAFAFTTDKANAYLAGGSTTALSYQIMSSVDGKIYTVGSIVAAAPPGDAIQAMAPGGGAATVFYTTNRGLHMISNSAVVQTVVPFDWPHSTNGQGLGWWLGRGDDPQRGPTVLHFVRDNDPYIFSPGQTGASGTATNIAIWADPNLQPPHQVGVPTAWFGTARYLYYAYSNPITNHSYLVRRNFHTGSTTHYWDLGINTCKAIAITDLFGGQPLLLVGSATNVVSTPMYRSGGSPLSDTASRYLGSATVDLPAADMGFPDEAKIEFGLRVEADALAAGTRYIEVQYELDDSGSFTPLGIATTSPVTEILFDNPNPTDRHMNLRLLLTNTDNTSTLVLRGVTLRRSINPTLYRWWEFDVWIPAGAGSYGDDLQNPKTLRDALWTARSAGIPVLYTDEQGDEFFVRLMKLEFKTLQLGVNDPPQEVAHITLLQASGRGLPLVVTHISGPATGSAWPLAVPLPTVGLGTGTWDTTVSTLSNITSSTVYPTWAIHGLAAYLKFTNNITSEYWEWSGTLGSGDTLAINFDPTKHTVIDSGGTSRSSGVTVASNWWGFAVGAANFRVQADGTDANTMISITAPLE